MTEPRFNVETFYDPGFLCTVIIVKYRQSPKTQTYSVRYAISNQLITDAQSVNYAVKTVTRQIINELRTKFHIGPWEKIELAIIMALAGESYPTHSISIPLCRVDSYREKAAVEFEGVEDLDESLWTGSGGLL